MNEIEKLYENAGVKRSKPSCAECFLDRHSCCRSYDECPELYPPFTAEKQLKIVKCILFSKWWMNLKRLQFAENFENALANLINSLWQDLTEEEKEQIKEILI